MGNIRSNHGHRLLLLDMQNRVKELHYAVVANDQMTVRSLLSEGVNINFPCYNPRNPSVKDGSTALIIAVSHNYTELVQILVHAGAYINKCDKSGNTPIFRAAFHGRLGLIELLTRAGADVNLSDFTGRTPLYVCVNNAIVHSCKSAIEKLLAAGAIVDKCDKSGQAPVHLAAHWKLVDVLQMLIDAKCNINLVDCQGRTPLYVCVSSLSTKLYEEDLRHQFTVILTLFKSGADMLNLLEWVLHKGPGFPASLLAQSADFSDWYHIQVTRPQMLKNLCRKQIQKLLCRTGNLIQQTNKLTLPYTLKIYLQRKTFFREPHHTWV